MSLTGAWKTGFWQRKVENLNNNLGLSIKLFQSSSRQTGSDDNEKPGLLVEKSRDPNNNLDLSIISEFLEADWFWWQRET